MARLGVKEVFEARTRLEEGRVCGIGRRNKSRELDKWDVHQDRGLSLALKPQSSHNMVISILWLPRLSILETYYIPKDGSLASYKEYISMLPSMDPPEAFGQHPNADVASQITEARTLFETLLSLQPQITPTRAGGQSREEKVRTDRHPGEGKPRGRKGCTQSSCLVRSLSWPLM